MKACAKHAKEPAKFYNSCPSCEVESLRKRVHKLEAQVAAAPVAAQSETGDLTCNFKFNDLGEAQFVEDLLKAAANKHRRANQFDDRPELLRALAGKLRRFINANTPTDTSGMPF